MWRETGLRDYMAGDRIWWETGLRQEMAGYRRTETGYGGRLDSERILRVT